MRMRRSPLAPLALALALVLPAPAVAQIAREAVDLAVVQKIREEGLERSRIEEMARWLTEVNGPRLTGSPGMKLANEWTAEKFRSWGLTNVQVEPWGDFGRGWANEAYAGRILTPFQQPLQGQPLAWTGSTQGTVRGQAMVVNAASMDDVEAYRGKLGGAILLMEEPQPTPPEFEHQDRRTPLEDLLEPQPAQAGGAAMSEADRQAMMARMRAGREAQKALQALATEEGALAFLRISSRDHGVIRGGSAGSRTAGDPEGLPHVALSREQYNQIWRNVSAGIPVELELNVRNRFYEEDLKAYNTLADLPGTDKADELVMLGAHLDSWHMGGGATDNAAGSVVM
ncbi:MAG TPA: M28 family peptidase, partial [Longimicrobiales bacterium]|nr:M28 family peptidase [Longimicrobiales bacterium]